MRSPCLGWLLVTSVTAVVLASPVAGATFNEHGVTLFGTFNGVEYTRYTGLFAGETAEGPFRVPYEIVAPSNPASGNGTVLVEPPHFFLGPTGRDGILGRVFLFDRGFAYASVGFSELGLNILDPTVPDLLIAGEPVIVGDLPPERDVEILARFTEALVADSYASSVLGPIARRYAFGSSQTAEALLELLHGASGQALFDLVFLFVTQWRPPFASPEVLAALPDDFEPLSGIGKVVFVAAEGDLLASESLELRSAVVGPLADPENYRLYEVAGAPHLPLDPPFNPLDAAPVARAALVAGHAWVGDGTPPPPSALLEEAPPGEVDPVYGFQTGIARDANGNALGGVRLPDVAIGRAFFLASLLGFEIVPGLPGLVGLWTDLACEPAPGSSESVPRFENHGAYVRRVTDQARALRSAGYLLPEDAELLVDTAAKSEVGSPGSCPALP